MEIWGALIIGSLVGAVSPLFGRSVSTALLDMLIGAIGGLVGVVLNQLIHADNNVMVIFGAFLLLAIVATVRPYVGTRQSRSTTTTTTTP